MAKQKKQQLKEEETPRQVPKGREEDYFFPNERITIKASSLEEAKRKLREIKK